MITIGYSTRESNPKLQEYLKKSCGHPKVQIIEKVNPNARSLTEVYNEILNESVNDIVVLCHDDIYFEKNGWGNHILKHFSRSEYGILGVAGSTHIPKSGMWWEDRRKMVGIVNHEHEGKKWESKYSASLGKEIKETIIVDGLFLVIHKQRIKKTFDETVTGFHMYDINFCFRNYLEGVKVGVIFDVRITHKSIGMTNEKWEENRRIFSETFKDNLPIKIAKTERDKLKILVSTQNETSLLTDLCVFLQDRDHNITYISKIEKNNTPFKLSKSNIKLLNLSEPPGYRLGDGNWYLNTTQGKVLSQPNNLYKINEVDFDIIIVGDESISNYINSLYPSIEKINLIENETDFEYFEKKIYETVNYLSLSQDKKQKIKILSGHSEKGGSTTAFINLTNNLNLKGFDCTFYGPQSWHLDKCNASLINEFKPEEDDILICHFLSLPERPKVKKVIFSLHEKNLFEIANVKPFWDEVIFLHEEHRRYHHRFNGDYSIIPNLKEILESRDKTHLDKIAGIIGTIDENKQTHISIERALKDGCEKVYVFGAISEPQYFESKVRPLFSDKVIYVGHTDNKQEMYDMIGRVYHSSISEVACLIKDECQSTNTKFFGNKATSHEVSTLTNEEIIQKWINVFDL